MGALAANASGWNIDLEPQSDSCKGLPTGDASDAALFASWLSAVRSALQPHGLRLTVAVASWSPVLSQFGTLAPAVDRLQNMQTYNGIGEAPWTRSLDAFLKATPLRAVGVGLGAWNDSKAQWWETPKGANAKVRLAVERKVPELAVFRLVPSTEVQPEWPLDFWWGALRAFVV